MSLITISQDFGSGGFFVAKKVAKTLDLQLFDDERLKKEALEMGVSPENLKGLDEKTPGFFDRLLGKKPGIYLDVLQSVVYKIAREANGILFGHGSQILLQDFGCALHVRIYASEAARINNVMEKMNIDKETAEKITHKKDVEFNDFFRFAFHKNFNDPSLYDLILNMEKISIDTAAKHIVDLARSEDIHACSIHALQSMECLALEKKIHTKLLQMDISSRMVTIEVPEPGLARAYGVTTNYEEREKVVEVLNNIPELSTVEIHIVVVPADV